jgi:Raf kinase inhibitor-like YbhB/YbcL family protein
MTVGVLMTVASVALATPTLVAVDRPELKVATVLRVWSKAIRAGGPIAPRFSSYHENVTPDVQWSPGPTQTHSYAVLVEDPDAPTAQPFVHWVVANIPTDAHSLPGGKATGGAQPRDAKAGRPNTVVDGTNGNQTIGWFGPHPPQGDTPHHYHFEVFALDRMLTVQQGATRDALVAAMARHVVAKGEFVATYQEKQ